MFKWIAMALLPYVAFVFIAESTNPFSRPGGRLERKRWKIARRISTALAVAVIVYALFRKTLEWENDLAIYTSVLSFVLVVGATFLRRRFK